MNSFTPRIYLSGPMTGKEDFNYAAFNSLARKLRLTGAIVFNPAEAFDGKTDLEWTEYMKLDLDMLLKADSVIVLDGWRDSIGARLEVAVALACGIPVRDLDKEPIVDTADPRAVVADLLGMTHD